MPDVPGWPDTSSGYLLFTEGYRYFLEQAQGAWWSSRTFHGGHFHMLVDPAGGVAPVELMPSR